MVIEYEKILIRLLNKSNRDILNKKELKKLEKLHEWYCTTLD